MYLLLQVYWSSSPWCQISSISNKRHEQLLKISPISTPRTNMISIHTSLYIYYTHGLVSTPEIHWFILSFPFKLCKLLVEPIFKKKNTICLLCADIFIRKWCTIPWFSHRNGRTEKVPTPPRYYTFFSGFQWLSWCFHVLTCWLTFGAPWFLILCTLSMFWKHFHVPNNLCWIYMFGTTLQQTRIANWKTTMLHSSIYQWCRICPKLFGGFLKWGYPPVIIHFFQGFSMKEPSSPGHALRPRRHLRFRPWFDGGIELASPD